MLILLTDRGLEAALPALAGLHQDLKIEPLSLGSVAHVVELTPEAVLVDAGENPAQAWAVMLELHHSNPAVPAIAVVEREALGLHPWHEAADELLFPGAPAAEIEVRLGMLRRRAGASGGSVIRLGPLAIDTETYRVTAAGRPLDLTFKEFELLRHLALHPGRVFTRPALLREVWGYDFYGGTRTVDVHVRRLRAKLGPEHEQLIETVRSVGYRAAEPAP